MNTIPIISGDNMGKGYEGNASSLNTCENIIMKPTIFYNKTIIKHLIVIFLDSFKFSDLKGY